MRRFYDALPGLVRVLLFAVLLVVVLVALFLLFEYGGDILDDGGVVGT